MYYMTFHYDRRGFGDLFFFREDILVGNWSCRSGSVTATGKLVNVISTGVWTGRAPSVATDEPAMVVNGFGRKFRLWTPSGNWSHYLIHPDGNKPGSAGCIVTLKLTPVERLVQLFKLLDNIIDVQGTVELEVRNKHGNHSSSRNV